MLSVRAARSTTKPDTRLRSQLPSSSCARGAPRMVPVFGSERFLRLSRAAAQGVSATNFKIFYPSTNYPQFSGSYPPVAPDSPQVIHRRPTDPAIPCPTGNATKSTTRGPGTGPRPVGERHGQADGTRGRRGRSAWAGGAGCSGRGRKTHGRHACRQGVEPAGHARPAGLGPGCWAVSGAPGSGRRNGSVARLLRPHRERSAPRR